MLAGAQMVDIVSVNIAAAKWAHISIVSQPGSLKVYVNNTLTINTNTGVIIPSSGSNLSWAIISKVVSTNSVSGSEALATNDLLWRNTLNKYHPQWNNLVLYYKFDQNLVPMWLIILSNITELSLQVREKVTDNAAFKYRIQAAYTDFSRFADRGVDREKYLLSNDIIMLGGVEFRWYNYNAFSVTKVTDYRGANAGIRRSHGCACFQWRWCGHGSGRKGASSNRKNIHCIHGFT